MDINSIQNSLKSGISREEFLDNCANAEKDNNNNASIYENTQMNAAAVLFNQLDTNQNGILDDNEFNELKNIDTEDGKDGENILSDSDLKGMYNKINNQIQKVYESQTPEEAYNTAINSGMSGDMLLGNLAFQISALQGMIDLRQSAADNTIKRLQERIDDLVLKSNVKNKELKEEYVNAKEKLAKLQKSSEKSEKSASSDSKNIEETTQNIKLLQAEITSLQQGGADETQLKEKNKELDKLNKTLERYNKSYNNHVSKQKDAETGKNGINLNQILDKIKSEDSKTKNQIEIFEKSIETEKNSAKADIEKYQAQISKLTAIQDYAIQQVQSESLEGYDENYVDEDMSKVTYDSKALKQTWQKKAPWLSDGFFNKATEVSKRIGCSPDALMGMMYSESGLKPTAVNKNGGATGLIQFMPKTARNMGTTTAAIKRMSAEQQLDYVEKYISSAKKSAGFKKDDKIDAGTLYALVFLPAFAKRNVLTSRGEIYYKANAGLDRNKDGQITKQELGQRVLKYKN